MIKYYRRYSFQAIKTQALLLFTNSLIFPVSRIILGGKKCYSFCNSFLKNHSQHFSTIIFLPHPLRSKIKIRETDFGYYSEIYFGDVYCQKILRAGMKIVDIGANIGVYTVLAAEKAGKDGKVIAVEPEAENYKKLLDNIKLNNFQNVIPINIALTDHEASEKLYISPDAGSHSLLSKGDEIISIEIQVKTLDKLLEELNFNRVDIIKIDAEGAEIPILKGARKTLKANPNAKIIVASYHYPSEIKEVCQFLNGIDFKTKVSSGGVVVTI